MQHDISVADVDAWFERNPKLLQDIFVQRADAFIVNKWLVRNGYCGLQEFSTTKQMSFSEDSSDPSSPSPDTRGEVFFSRHTRNNSKKHLRHDYAKSKYRHMFRTYEPPVAASDITTDDRRTTLKEMRMFRSLPPSSSNLLSVLIQSKVRLPRYPSKDIEKKREQRYTNEMEFFMDIVKDISNDLDLLSLSEKVIANINVLTDADHASIFVVEGKNNNKRSLVSKIFDVHSGTKFMPTKNVDNCIRVPWGKGIIGYVAEHGETVNLLEAHKDDRYNDDVDRITGYKTGSLLCMPIRNAAEEIVGVAQVINKTTAIGFTKEDEKIVSAYLAFCGIAIHNAKIFEAYSSEYERNKQLLEVVHDLFEEQTSLDDVMLKIMQRAQVLLKCERCSVLLRDPNSERPLLWKAWVALKPDGSLIQKELLSKAWVALKQGDSLLQEKSFNRVFDLSYPVKNGHSAISLDPCADLQLGNKIAELVLLTEETVNISDAYSDPRFDKDADSLTGFQTKSILCKPIRNRYGQITGVAEIINRSDGMPFDDHDEQLFEAFTIFCGLGINNAQLYEEVALSAAKQNVALEMLSYHAGVEPDEVEKIKSQRIPMACELRLNELSFNDFSLTNDEMLIGGIRLFRDLGFMKNCRIDYETLIRWLTTVKKNYRNIAYHNWRHAFNVCQLMFATMQKCNTRPMLSRVESLALIVGCICHDLDHRGTNNAFQEKTGSALTQLYGTRATLEHHHFNHALMILNSEATNIFNNFSSEEYSEVIGLLKHAILATDLSLHIQCRNKWFEMVDAGRINWDDKELKEIFRSILMTTCDIGAITKPWEISRKVADLVMTEFFDQGDKERSELKIQPQTHMDREKQDQLPALQLGWIDGICLPLYKSLAKFDRSFQPMLDGILANRAKWELIDAERLGKQVSRESSV